MKQTHQELAAKVLNDPSGFKTCEGCGTVVERDVAMCPECKAYRFDETEEHVVERAILLASREQKTVSPDELEF